MSLQRYLGNGWIQRHETSPEEVRDLLSVVERDLAQSRVPGLAPEWRFAIAYNAALQLAILALAASGFRGERQNKHARTIECLEYTLGVSPKEVAVLDTFRRKRHASTYEHVGAVSDREADEMIAFAERLSERVIEWLRSNHAPLLP